MTTVSNYYQLEIENKHLKEEVHKLQQLWHEECDDSEYLKQKLEKIKELKSELSCSGNDDVAETVCGIKKEIKEILDSQEYSGGSSPAPKNKFATISEGRDSQEKE